MDYGKRAWDVRRLSNRRVSSDVWYGRRALMFVASRSKAATVIML